MTTPADIHQVPVGKLREIFGADAALYIHVKQYGTTYAIIVSETRVMADARLVDLRSGKTLWEGSAGASSGEGDSASGGGVVGLLVKAVVSQIVDTLSNRGHAIAGMATQRLLAAGRPNAILYGPRSPLYKGRAGGVPFAFTAFALEGGRTSFDDFGVQAQSDLINFGEGTFSLKVLGDITGFGGGGQGGIVAGEFNPVEVVVPNQ